MLRKNFFTLVLAAAAFAEASAATPPSPYQDKPEPVRGIYVDDLKQWDNKTAIVLKKPDDKDQTIVERRGSVLVAPGVTIDVVTEDNQVNFPFFFELRQAGSKAAPPRTLLRYAVMDLSDAEWYFPGNGFVYVRSLQWHLCGPRTIRKFRWTGAAIEEVPQPLLWIDQTAHVESTMPLYDVPDGHHVVATVLKGSDVQVIGMQPTVRWDTDGPDALLVKTPLGLLGWHRFFGGTPESDGRLDIYQCN